jgi:hypothetical protein
MGGGGSSSGYGIQGSVSNGSNVSSEFSQSSSSSFSQTLDSEISRQQAEILSSRQEVFENDFLPTWKSAYSEIDKSLNYARSKFAPAKQYSLGMVEDNLALIDQAIADVSMDSPVMKATMALQSKEINSAFNAAQKATAQNLAKQNLLGRGSGVSATLTAQNNRARASALSDAYNNTIIQNNAQKQNLLGLRSEAANTGIAANQSILEAELATENAAVAQRTNMLNNLACLMPKPTQDVAYHNMSQSSSSSVSSGYSKGKNSSVGFGENWNSASNASVG